jgi:hypothetical protein
MHLLTAFFRCEGVAKSQARTFTPVVTSKRLHAYQTTETELFIH